MEDKPTNEVILERVNNWIDNTKLYRQEQKELIVSNQKCLIEKIDKINIKFEALPCESRKGWYQSLSRQVGFMWAVLTILIGLVVTGLVQISK